MPVTNRGVREVIRDRKQDQADRQRQGIRPGFEKRENQPRKR